MEPDAPILAVAFDMDGLMFDTEALFFQVATEMLQRRGKVFTREIMAAMIGRQWPVAGAAFKAMAGLDEPLDDLLVEAKSRFDLLVDTAVHTTPGLFALLAHLEQVGLPRCVATSSRRSAAERLLGNHHLLPHFAFLLTAEDVSRSKPDPEIYEKAAARFGIAPASLLVLEDSPAGTTSARAAGAFVVGVPHDYSPPEGLGAAHRLVERLDDPWLLQRLQSR